MDSNRLIYHLRRVHSIRFSSVSLSLIAPPFWKLLHDLKGVKELEVHHMTFRSPHDFFGFVNELPELESLTIVRPTWQGKGEWDLKRQEPQRARVLTRGGSRESGSSRRGLCIPVFDLGRMCQREILDWLMAQNPIPAIHTFRLDLANTNVRGGDITKFLEVAGSTIQHIQVRLSGDFSGNVDFASCTNLKSIRVDGLTIGDLCRPTYLRASEQFLRRTLENLPSSRLEQIVLSYTMTTHDAALFGIPDTSLLQMYNWELVADILRNRHQDKKSCELDIQGHHSGAHHTYTQSPDHDHKCSKMELKIEISQFPQYLQASAKEYMTKGPFADWCQNGNEGDLVNIDFMPVRDFILPLPFSGLDFERTSHSRRWL
ncbi:hypothetical protein AX16_004646 [Volvariella volvacea WC 439]|nr:hypothetical protein AX16_004646 [Volvariella volvacea WC 439]